MLIQRNSVFLGESPLSPYNSRSFQPPAFLALPVVDAPQNGQVAQLVEQRTENPCVGGSIPPLATKHQRVSVV